MTLTAWPPRNNNLDQAKCYIQLTFGDPLPNGEWSRRFQRCLDRLVHPEYWEYYVPDNPYEYFGAHFVTSDRVKFDEELKNIQRIEATEVMPFTDLKVIDFVESAKARSREIEYDSDGYLLQIPKATDTDDESKVAAESENEKVVASENRKKQKEDSSIDNDSFVKWCHERLRGIMLILIYQGRGGLDKSMFLFLYQNEIPRNHGKETYRHLVEQMKDAAGTKCQSNSMKVVDWSKKEYVDVLNDLSDLESKLGVWGELSKQERGKIYGLHKRNIPHRLSHEEEQEWLAIYEQDYFLRDACGCDEIWNGEKYVDGEKWHWKRKLEMALFFAVHNWIMETDEGYEWQKAYIERKKRNVNYCLPLGGERDPCPVPPHRLPDPNSEPEESIHSWDLSKVGDDDESVVSSGGTSTSAKEWLKQLIEKERNEQDELMDDFIVNGEDVECEDVESEDDDSKEQGMEVYKEDDGLQDTVDTGSEDENGNNVDDTNDSEDEVLVHRKNKTKSKMIAKGVLFGSDSE